MSSDSSIVELLRRWQAGDESAATQIFKYYDDRLLELARRLMGPYLASRVSAESVVQLALGTFLKRSSHGEYMLTDTISVSHLLTQITRNKVRKMAEFHRAAKRSIGREGNGDELVQIAAKGPTPEHSLMLLDLVQTALDRLPERSRPCVVLFLEGHTHTEVAEKLNVSRATSQRALQRFQSDIRRISGETNN